MPDGDKTVLVALSADLEVAHRAYLKSLGVAGFEVVKVLSAEQALAQAGAAALVVIGAATGVKGLPGLELLALLEEARPLPACPVLLLHGAARDVESPLSVLGKWSDARVALGLDAPRPVTQPPGFEPRPALVKLKSIDPTLEIATRREPAAASEPDETVEQEAPPGIEPDAISPADGHILLTEAEALTPTPDDPDRTEEVSDPPEFAAGAPGATALPTAAPLPATKPPSENLRARPVAPNGLAPTGAAPSVGHVAPASRRVAPPAAPRAVARRGRTLLVLSLVALLVLAVGSFLVVRFVLPSLSQPTLPPLAAVVPPGPTGAVPSGGGDAGGPEGDAGAAAGRDVDSGPDEALDSGPPEPAELAPEDGPLPDELVLPFAFTRNGVDPRPTDRALLRRIVRHLIENPSTRVELVGFAGPDERPGTHARLGVQRARAARDTITARGPSRRRFEVRAGEQRDQVADGNPDAARRVVMHITRR